MLTLFGVTVLSLMMLMYALEARGRTFVLAFAIFCALSSLYGFLSGAWLFGVVEAVWAGIAFGRFVGGSPVRRGDREMRSPRRAQGSFGNTRPGEGSGGPLVLCP